MGGGDGAAFKRPGDGARLQRVLGLGSRRAPRSLPAGGPAQRRTAPPPPGHASAGPAAMSSHIAKSESKTSLLKAAASGGSRVPRHGPAREPGLPGRRLPGTSPGTPPPSGDPSSRRPLCRPAPREEGARGSRRGLPQAHCRPREALPAAASRPSPPSPLPPARGRDGEERGLSPALGLRGSLRAPGRGDSAPAAASEADPFLHQLRPMLSSAFGQVRAAPPARAPGKGARDPARLRAHSPPAASRGPGHAPRSPSAALRPGRHSSSPVPDSAP
ncbi:Calcium-binding protein 1 [Vulpes lagopus]